jgi:hypothetical protein
LRGVNAECGAERVHAFVEHRHFVRVARRHP